MAQEAYSSVPHSFVFHRGQIGKNVGQLILDVRKVMEPYTAESLKVRIRIEPAKKGPNHRRGRWFCLDDDHFST